jgi:hypothetical protein
VPAIRIKWVCVNYENRSAPYQRVSLSGPSHNGMVTAARFSNIWPSHPKPLRAQPQISAPGRWMQSTHLHLISSSTPPGRFNYYICELGTLACQILHGRLLFSVCANPHPPWVPCAPQPYGKASDCQKSPFQDCQLQIRCFRNC